MIRETTEISALHTAAMMICSIELMCAAGGRGFVYAIAPGDLVAVLSDAYFEGGDVLFLPSVCGEQ